MGVCATGQWQCAGGGVVCVAPAPSATDAFNDTRQLDTNCDGVDGLLSEAIFVRAGSASAAGAAGDVSALTAGPQALGRPNNPVATLARAFEIMAARKTLNPSSPIRQLHLAASDTNYVLPDALVLTAADAGFAIVGGYAVSMVSSVEGGVTVSTGSWTAGSGGTGIVAYGGIAEVGERAALTADVVSSVISVTDPSNIVFRNIGLMVTAPPAGFGHVAGLRCSLSAGSSARCSGMTLDGFSLTMEGGAASARVVPVASRTSRPTPSSPAVPRPMPPMAAARAARTARRRPTCSAKSATSPPSLRQVAPPSRTPTR